MEQKDQGSSEVERPETKSDDEGQTGVVELGRLEREKKINDGWR